MEKLATNEQLLDAIRAELGWLREKGGFDSTHALDVLGNIAVLVGVPLDNDEDDLDDDEDVYPEFANLERGSYWKNYRKAEEQK